MRELELTFEESSVQLMRMKFFLTLNLRDWDHVSSHEMNPEKKRHLSQSYYSIGYRMEQNVVRWMELLDEAQIKSTCFVLGEFAQRFPLIIQKLHREGHEIASQGYAYEPLESLSSYEFKENLKRGVGMIGDLTGIQPQGYRPPISLIEAPHDYEDQLTQMGFTYESSSADFKKTSLKQIYTDSSFLRRFSQSGGLRKIPFWFYQSSLQWMKKQDGKFILEIEPRELDPGHPQIPVSKKEKIRLYRGTRSLELQLKSLLSSYEWGTIEAQQ
ncbi:MAG: hypothetical protein CL678_07135 [Bdellovibrionaceae bacterium]|nr:hypothetical protein [Pseudobdellovibrionaceae bacterium]|tara:strand:- start:87 stop:899 length:813 start_codon:yes stop_codon:yes gene_type:complete